MGKVRKTITLTLPAEWEDKIERFRRKQGFQTWAEMVRRLLINAVYSSHRKKLRFTLDEDGELVLLIKRLVDPDEGTAEVENMGDVDGFFHRLKEAFLTGYISEITVVPATKPEEVIKILKGELDG